MMMMITVQKIGFQPLLKCVERKAFVLQSELYRVQEKKTKLFFFAISSIKLG